MRIRVEVKYTLTLSFHRLNHKCCDEHTASNMVTSTIKCVQGNITLLNINTDTQI